MYSNWSYSPETPNLGQIRRFVEPCDLEIWRMTLKNNRAPLLCCFQLCAWFHCHMWIQTGVRVRKRLSWVLTSVTLTFDLWPWPFVWTSLLTMVITPENFMMIRWWEHGEKGVTDRRTDRRTDGRTDWTSHIAAWSQLKTFEYMVCKMVAIVSRLQCVKTYSDVIMDAVASQSPASRLFTQLFIQAQIKENIKAQRHWPLWGEFTGDWWIPCTKGQ